MPMMPQSWAQQALGRQSRFWTREWKPTTPFSVAASLRRLASRPTPLPRALPLSAREGLPALRRPARRLRAAMPDATMVHTLLALRRGGMQIAGGVAPQANIIAIQVFSLFTDSAGGPQSCANANR